ncbi:hypothetical protein ACIQ6V_33750 [Streptomyces sp. NPDC096198]|uniref:hypothetical protein n=1 Tax=Streptomyces sp. NPDC096198 TaxID=3366080 RepID=UPI00380E5B0C
MTTPKDPFVTGEGVGSFFRGIGATVAFLNKIGENSAANSKVGQAGFPDYAPFNCVPEALKENHLVNLFHPE